MLTVDWLLKNTFILINKHSSLVRYKLNTQQTLISCTPLNPGSWRWLEVSVGKHFT